jgi:hypothetical protein
MTKRMQGWLAIAAAMLLFFVGTAVFVGITAAAGFTITVVGLGAFIFLLVYGISKLMEI